MSGFNDVIRYAHSDLPLFRDTKKLRRNDRFDVVSELPYLYDRKNPLWGWVIDIDPTGGGTSHSRYIVYSPDGEIYQENCAGVYSRPWYQWKLAPEVLKRVEQVRAWYRYYQSDV